MKSKTGKLRKGILFSVAIALMVFLLPAPGICDLRPLDASEMDDVIGQQGFSQFSIEDLGGDSYEMKVWLNINTEQYTTIDSLKLGWNERYEDKNPTPEFKWDHDWENVVIGSEGEYFVTEGFYFKVQFDDFSTDQRRLKSVTMGVDYAEGDIVADFLSFSGTVIPGAGPPQFNRHNEPIFADFGRGTLQVGYDEDVRAGAELTINVHDNTLGFWMNFDNALFVPDP